MSLEISTPETYRIARYSQRIIHKARNLKFGKKAERILSTSREDRPLILEHFAHLRAFIVCALQDTEDLRVEQLKSALLYHVDRLIEETSRRVRLRDKRVALGFIRIVEAVHRNLFNEIARTRAPLTYCPDQWSKYVNSAVAVYGSDL